MILEQFSKVSTSESSETVMHGMKAYKKTQKREQTDYKAIKSSKHKLHIHKL